MHEKGIKKMTKTMNPKELAEKFGTDPRTVRKFLRSDARENGLGTPGKGSRWEIEAKTVRSLQTRFNRWNDAKNSNPTESDETTES